MIHSRRTELLSEHHASCELGNCFAGVKPPLVSIPRLSVSMDFCNFFRSGFITSGPDLIGEQ